MNEGTTVSVAEGARRFSELVNRAGYGREVITVTKRGRPIAVIVGYPEQDQDDSDLETEQANDS